MGIQEKTITDVQPKRRFGRDFFERISWVDLVLNALRVIIIVLVIVFEPGGLYGRWMKIRFFFETFPYYRKSSFVRQKSYLKTERMR